MSVRRLPLLAATALLLGLSAGRAGGDDPPAGPAPAMGDEPESPAAELDGQIKTAIEKGVAFLKSQQDTKTGSWGNIGCHNPAYAGKGTVWQHPWGPTSLALYAMLKCEVPVTDPAIVKGFEWLKKQKLVDDTSAYEISAALLAVTAVADPFKKSKDSQAAGAKVRLSGEWRSWAASLQASLVKRRQPRGWRYHPSQTDPGGTEDVSSTQFAVLALAACDRCGLTTDPSVFADAAAFVLTLQESEGPPTERAVRARSKAPTKPDPDAGRYGKPKTDEPPKDQSRGFHYSVHPTTKGNDTLVTGSRTACGVGALALARYALDGPDAKPLPAPKPRPLAKALDRGIYDGLAWLSTNWSEWANPNDAGSGRNIYYLYCFERAMDLTGAERLGDHTWYLEMVKSLLPAQDAEKGSWDQKNGQVGDRNPVCDTAFALLFLRRAAKNGVPMPIVTTSDDGPPVDNGGGVSGGGK